LHWIICGDGLGLSLCPVVTHKRSWLRPKLGIIDLWFKFKGMLTWGIDTSLWFKFKGMLTWGIDTSLQVHELLFYAFQSDLNTQFSWNLSIITHPLMKLPLSVTVMMVHKSKFNINNEFGAKKHYDILLLTWLKVNFNKKSYFMQQQKKVSF